MTSMLSPSAIGRIEILSRWVGFSDPPSRLAKLTITNVGEHLARQQALEAMSDELPARVFTRLLRALARPVIPRLDPTIFDVPCH